MTKNKILSEVFHPKITKFFAAKRLRLDVSAEIPKLNIYWGKDNDDQDFMVWIKELILAKKRKLIVQPKISSKHPTANQNAAIVSSFSTQEPSKTVPPILCHCEMPIARRQVTCTDPQTRPQIKNFGKTYLFCQRK